MHELSLSPTICLRIQQSRRSGGEGRREAENLKFSRRIKHTQTTRNERETPTGPTSVINLIRAFIRFALSCIGVFLPLRKLFAAREAPLVCLMATATRQQIPLGIVIDAYAHTLSGSRRRTLEQLADDLNAGYELRDALASDYSHTPFIPPVGIRRKPARLFTKETLSCLLVGEASDNLQAGTQVAHERVQAILRGSERSLHLLAIYFLFLIGSIFSITSFLFYFIVPKYKMIFEDFGTELPARTRLLTSVGDLLFTPMFVFVGIPLLVCLVLGGLLIATRRIPLPRFLSVFGPYYHAIDLPIVYRFLRVTLEQNRPLEPTFNGLWLCHHRSWIRRQANECLHTIQDGVDLATAMKMSRLLTTAQAGYLHGANTPRQQARALEFIAHQSELKMAYWTRLFNAIAKPAVVIAIAGLVAFIWLGMFAPLIHLITGFG